ncbi:beta-ketoacyl synthase chain length factor [Undibacterium flavidum]|uniref:Beta-ketoacyl synthase chain length factor n=1 Tax=Undibacterium flavidum TaxID=2762297 RepID=A0ABR6YC48_9BURK|nr:beta-ketoacyl synthase chain length factor [Undibacterium flavidum]MBC3874119.1 beta-ketoacyl synthase chain length factor [Undibacterium flavidum]
MQQNSVHFSIAKHAQWAPGRNSDQAWQEWLLQPSVIRETDGEPPAVKDMPAMLRRRARLLGRMALEVAYTCLDDLTEVPTIFCSRHGEVIHAVELIKEQITEGAISPIGFSSAVHNATAGLFSIANKDRSNHIAIAAGVSTIEHAVIEACSLIGEGAKAVLLVNYEQPLPAIFHTFEDCIEQAYAWAWLIVPAEAEKASFNLEWNPAQKNLNENFTTEQNQPPGLEILRFYLNKQNSLERVTRNHHWIWSYNNAPT